MSFESVINRINEFATSNINVTFKEDSLDMVLVKKLADSNTIIEGKASGNQTHIAFSSGEMDIFPYLHNYRYLEADFKSEEYNNKFKRKFVLKLPITLLENNLKYLDNEEIQENKEIHTYTTIGRSRRKPKKEGGPSSYQIEMSYLDLDDPKFIDFRNRLIENDYLIILKITNTVEYFVLGIKNSDAIEFNLSQYIGFHFKDNAPIILVDLPQKKEFNDINLEHPEIGELLDFNPNLIIYGPPGTGKTYLVNSLKKYFDYYKFITYHQSYSYEQFVEGITAKVNNDSHTVEYLVEDGIFKEICEYANENPHENVALFIDEINRGNISKIFGELITLIESSKRKGQLEETSVTLPYSKKPFIVPQNLYIIGTMNTADRSIVLLDSALRRRFSFFEISPKFDDFNEGNEKIKETIRAVKKVNEIIQKELGKDQRIGNSYFYKLLAIKDEKLEQTIKSIWIYQILPLLQEYFYNNPKKITELLGNLVDASEQRFSFNINYSISVSELLEQLKIMGDDSDNEI